MVNHYKTSTFDKGGELYTYINMRHYNKSESPIANLLRLKGGVENILVVDIKPILNDNEALVTVISNEDMSVSVTKSSCCHINKYLIPVEAVKSGKVTLSIAV